MEDKQQSKQQVEETFEDYMLNARDEFVMAVKNEERSNFLLTAIDSFLICFDQMREKLTSPLPASYSDGQKEEWISVKDRLPNDREKVLVCKYNRTVKEASFLKKDQWDRLDQFIIGGAYYDTVKWITHWMPMPMPPNTYSAPTISKEDEQ